MCNNIIFSDVVTKLNEIAEIYTLRPWPSNTHYLHNLCIHQSEPELKISIYRTDSLSKRKACINSRRYKLLTTQKDMQLFYIQIFVTQRLSLVWYCRWFRTLHNEIKSSYTNAWSKLLQMCPKVIKSETEIQNLLL